MFEGVQKKLGFGFMRLPRKNGEIDYTELNAMVDAFIASGFNYFDTAHGYEGTKSEIAIRKCVSKRYPREKFILANKLSENYFKTEADIRPFFESQLKACGVDYFDFYLMHAQSKGNFPQYKRCRAYEQAFSLKAEGKVRHVGLSFHDTAAVLDEILTAYPQVEFVQIQLNYLDYDDPAVQSRKCLEVCRKHGKPVIAMEPVKGGHLVRLPESAEGIFAALGSASAASYAVRFAAGCEGVFMVLSGMSSMPQMADNISYMKDFAPLTEREMQAVASVCAVFKGMHTIPCTACRYCVDGCPQKISIPDLFACLNTKNIHNYWNADYYYNVHTEKGGKASACIECGKCEKICPQHLSIRTLLKSVAKEFEKPHENFAD